MNIENIFWSYNSISSMPNIIEKFGEPHQAKSHRTWVFTLNNYTEAQGEFIKAWEGVTRIAVGREVGVEGTPHLQGVVVWKTTKRFTQLKKLLKTAHFEKCKDLDMAFNYCRKELNMLCDIDNREQGARTDLAKCYTAVRAGKTLAEYLDESEPGFQAIQVFKVARAELYKPPRWRPITVHWLWGETETGKSRLANVEGSYQKPKGKWWDRYNGEKTIVIDEVDTDTYDFREWLKLLDKYTFQGETKGGWVWVYYDTVYITSEKHPKELFRKVDANLKQLWRRLTSISNFYWHEDRGTRSIWSITHYRDSEKGTSVTKYNTDYEVVEGPLYNRVVGRDIFCDV